MSYLSINLPYVKDLKADDPTSRLVVSAVDQSNLDLLNSPAIFGGTIDGSLIGSTQAGDAYFLSLTAGNSVAGYPVTFYGLPGSYARWLPDRRLWDVNGDLRVSNSSYLGDITIAGNVISPTGLNSDLVLAVNGTGRLNLDRLPLLSQERQEIDAGMMVEFAHGQGFFGAREDGFFSWVPSATIVTDGDGRRSVLGDSGKVQAAEIKTNLITPETDDGLLLAGETHADVLRVDGVFDASNATSVVFANGQLSGDWVDGGLIRADIQGNAGTVTDGVYRRDFAADFSILKADLKGQPASVALPENTFVGHLPGKGVGPVSVRELIQLLPTPLPVDIAGVAQGNIRNSAMIDHSIIKADVAGQPVALYVPEKRILGRASNDLIRPLTFEEILTFAEGPLAADIRGNAQTVTDGVYRHSFSADNSILWAKAKGSPEALVIPEATVLGRLPGGDVRPLSALDIISLLPDPVPIRVRDGVRTTDFTEDNTMLIADSAQHPVAMTVPPRRVVGRGPSGGIRPLSIEELISYAVGPLVTDISGNAQTVTDGLYGHSFTSDNSILKADISGNPIALHVPERTIIGRQPGGEISTLTIDELVAFATGPLDVSIMGNAGTVTDGLYRDDFSNDHTILKADSAGHPIELYVPEKSVIGRRVGGVIEPLSVEDLISYATGPLDTNIVGNAGTVTDGLYRHGFAEDHTILKADLAGEPVHLHVPEKTIIGRGEDGAISALTIDQFLAFSPGPLDVSISGNSATVTDGLYRHAFANGHTILKADLAGEPVELLVPERRIIGRREGGVIESLSIEDLLTFAEGPLHADIQGNAATVTDGLYGSYFASDHTILKADVAGEPIELPVPERRIIGRREGGVIEPLSVEDLLTFAEGPLDVDIKGNAATVTDGIYGAHFSSDHTILKADIAGEPIELHVPERTVVGRDVDGLISPLTIEQLVSFADAPLEVDIKGNAATVTDGIYGAHFSSDHTILKADVAGQPLELYVREGTVVGRGPGGVIGTLTIEQLVEFALGPLDVSILGNAMTVNDGLYRKDFDAVHSILVADDAHVPHAISIPEGTLVGRLVGGDGIRAIRVDELLTMLPDPVPIRVLKGLTSDMFQSDHSIIKADIAGTVTELVIPENTVVGRKEGGVIAAIPFSEIGGGQSPTVEDVFLDGISIPVCDPKITTSRLTLTGNVIEGVCTLPDGVKDGMRKVILTRTGSLRRGQTIRVKGNFYAPMYGHVDCIFRFNSESVTLEWVETDKAWVSAATGCFDERVSDVDVDDSATADNVIHLLDNDSGYSVPINFFDPRGPVILFVTEIPKSGEELASPTTAIFSLCGGRSRGGVTHRMCDMPGTNGEHLDMEWGQVGYPRLRYGKLPSVQMGVWNRFKVNVLQTQASFDNSIGGNVSFTVDNLSLRDDDLDGDCAINLAQPNGSFIIMVRDVVSESGASAVFMASGSLRTGGMAHRMNTFPGSLGEQLGMTWLPMRMPTLRFALMPTEQTGRWFRYAVTCVIAS